MMNVLPGGLSLVTVTSYDGGNTESIHFRGINDLEPPIRFLMACGPLANIDAARNCVDQVVRMTGNKWESVRMKAVGFTPLEWAARRGNAEIVDWLCTDARTKALIHEGCPVGWACYTGQVAIARKLVGYGADPSKTDDVLFFNCPPLLVAAENGQLEAMKFLVEELGQDIHMRGPASGRNVISSIETSPNWAELEGHREARNWAIRKMGGRL